MALWRLGSDDRARVSAIVFCTRGSGCGFLRSGGARGPPGDSRGLGPAAPVPSIGPDVLHADEVSHLSLLVLVDQRLGRRGGGRERRRQVGPHRDRFLGQRQPAPGGRRVFFLMLRRPPRSTLFPYTT